jgi:hypothetical protein
MIRGFASGLVEMGLHVVDHGIFPAFGDDSGSQSFRVIAWGWWRIRWRFWLVPTRLFSPSKKAKGLAVPDIWFEEDELMRIAVAGQSNGSLVEHDALQDTYEMDLMLVLLSYYQP